MTTWTGTVIALIIILVYEIIIGRDRHVRRGTTFQQAQRRARELGRPLIVVGDPHRGIGSNFYYWMGNSWGYHIADQLIDTDPCEQCIRDPRTIKSELGPALSEQPSDSAVIFISCMLEYIHPLEPTIQEVNRVAGGPSNIFVVYTDRWSLAGISYPGWLLGQPEVCNVINSAPPDSTTIEYRAIC